MTTMTAFSPNIRSFKNDQSGTALIELAVVLPILLAISLGVFEFGNAIYGRHLIENGVRDAARYAAGLKSSIADGDVKCIALTGGIQGGNCTPGTSPSCTTTCRVAWWNNASTITVTPTPVPNGPTSCGTTQCYRGPDPIMLVTVSTDVPYAGLGFLGYFGLSNLTMHVQHEERLYGIR